MRHIWIVAFVAALGCEHGKGGGPPPGEDAGTSSGRSCGGLLPTPCPENEFCDFINNNCGNGDEPGKCRLKPNDCNDNFDPVCACDGQIHPNQCDAEALGFDVNEQGTCPVDAGKFACGFRSCTINSEYCQIQFSDVAGEPNTFSCRAIPGCSAQVATCACLLGAGEPCADMCSGDGATGLTVSCPGG